MIMARLVTAEEGEGRKEEKEKDRGESLLGQKQDLSSGSISVTHDILSDRIDGIVMGSRIFWP